MNKKLNKWKTKKGIIKLHQVRTKVGFDTPKLPPRMTKELQQRGMREQLPPPKGQIALEVI